MSKKYPDQTVKIYDIEFPNKGIGDWNGNKVTIKNTLPDQTVLADIKKKHKQFEGRLKGIIEKADYETEPACPRFGSCGGCTYQNISYEKQLEIKQKTVKDLLDKAGLTGFEFLPVKPSPITESYRNKMEFSFGDNGAEGLLSLGMRKRESYYEVVDASCCRITHPDIRKTLETTINFFRQTDETFFHKTRHTGTLRHLLVRRGYFTGEMTVNLVTTSEMKADLTDWKNALLALPLEGKIVGITQIINDSVADVVKADKTVRLYGKDWFNDKLLGLDFKISIFSFFQTNSAGAEVLYSTVREFSGNEKCKTIFDLYCGTGTITQILSPNAEKVYGIEIVEEAVAAAK
ncbi:MAG: 23S rRNA (uracil(1939)-C(5))-methyltransferase RlmD, partial [Firmicutes bacterium]|nr:23S rRNA (uracil(1939)-C(5))-methyltransferase RlmD [Bacillota bacterium]